MKPGVTVVIPTIGTPHREKTLQRALKSVVDQDNVLTPAPKVIVTQDTEHAGSAVTRNQGLFLAETEWVAFLDDDDEWLPHHLSVLVQAQQESGADVVYPWFRVVSQTNPFDPFPGVFRRPFDPMKLRQANYIPTTVLARTELLRDVGGFEPYGDQKESACDDWGLWFKLLEKGAEFYHAPWVTWLWHWHGQHTSGLGDRW